MKPNKDSDVLHWPDVDGDGEARVVCPDLLTDDAHNEVGGPEDGLLVQRAGEHEAGLAPGDLDTDRGLVQVGGEREKDVLAHHAYSADLADSGADT